MALMLTRAGLLGGIHRAAETKPIARTSLLTGTAGAAGLVLGRYGARRRGPLVAAATGAGLSLIGMTAIGDGLVASGLTFLGYRTGVKMTSTPAAAAPIAAVSTKKR